MAETGTLKVRVFTSVAEIPVEGATVVVTESGSGGKYKLLSVQATDQNGMIKPIYLETPNMGESTAPNGEGDRQPFALCNVWAEHPGYAMLKAEDVQVFPGVETVQNMELIPLGETENSLETRDQRPSSAQNL